MNINNYCASMGTSTYSTTGVGATVSGVFGYQTYITLANINDGTSNTIAMSEQLVGDPNAASARFSMATGNGGAPGGTSGVLDVSSIGGSITGAVNALKVDINACNTQFLSGPRDNDRGYRWLMGEPGWFLFNTVVPPNGGGLAIWNSCRIGCCSTGQAEHANYNNASSNHSGGVNVGMCDGSVRFIKNTINIPTWWALGTRANGEAISSDSY